MAFKVNSNKAAIDLCQDGGFQQCVILGFSETKGYFLSAAGDSPENAEIATSVALKIKEGLTTTKLPVKLAI